jgi:hypothetical protein
VLEIRNDPFLGEIIAKVGEQPQIHAVVVGAPGEAGWCTVTAATEAASNASCEHDPSLATEHERAVGLAHLPPAHPCQPTAEHTSQALRAFHRPFRSIHASVEHLVAVPTCPLGAALGGAARWRRFAQTSAPLPDCLVGDHDATLYYQLLDLPEAQRDR